MPAFMSIMRLSSTFSVLASSEPPQAARAKQPAIVAIAILNFIVLSLPCELADISVSDAGQFLRLNQSFVGERPIDAAAEP
jgi:hypothetical protein